MDSFEFNKIAGAVLGTALGVMALSIVSEIIFAPAEAEQPGMVVAGVDPAGDEHGGGAAAPEIVPIAVRLASADIAAGEKSTGKCKSCHVFGEGDLKKMPGPNLYGIVGGPVAHLEGFGYSDALMAAHNEGMTWTFENLDEFLTSPKLDIPGTAMTFAGLKNPDERANVIAYLNSNSANPLPLPDPAAVPAESAAAPAEGAAPAADPHAAAPEPAAPPAAAEPMAPPSPAPPAAQAPPDSAAPAPVPAPAEPAPATP